MNRKSFFISALVSIFILSNGNVLALGSSFPLLDGSARRTSSNVNTVALSSKEGTNPQKWGIDTGTTEYKVYVQKDDDITITVQHACEGKHGEMDTTGKDYEFHDALPAAANTIGISQTEWRMFKTDSNEEITGDATTFTSGSLNGNLLHCQDYGGTFSQSFITPLVNASKSAISTVPGHEDFRVYIVQVREINKPGSDTEGSGKGFTIETSGGEAYVTPREFPHDDNDVTTIDYPEDRAYALLEGNRVSEGHPRYHSDYFFNFAADCRIRNGDEIFLKWFDADVGLNQDANMKLKLYANGVAVPLQAYRTTADPEQTTQNSAMVKVNQGSSNSIEGVELMGGASNMGKSGIYGVAGFNAYRNVSYKVEWTDVDSDNALQFWLPFSEINILEKCDEPSRSISGNCDAVSGTYKYTEVPDEKHDVHIQFAVNNSAVTAPTNGWSGEDDYVVTTDDNNSFNVEVPKAYKQDPLHTWARAFVVQPDGSWDWITTGIHLGVCDVPSFYIDDITIGGSLGSTTTPGQAYDVSFTVKNAESGPTHSGFRTYYTTSFYEEGSFPGYDTTISDTVNGESSITKSVNDVSIPSDAQVGDAYCLRLSVSHERGHSDGDTASLVDWDTDNDDEVCLRILESPYLQVNGADVWAGGGFSDTVSNPTTCSYGLFRNATIRSVNNGTIGALGEFAVGASGDGNDSAIGIFSFGSSGGLLSDSLTLANTPTPLGNLSVEGKCITNYFTLLRNTADVEFYSNDRDINKDSITRISEGEKRIVLVDGVATVNRDIVYRDYNVDNKAEIPFFMLVATEGINIVGDVDKLNGLFVSLKDINTCSDRPVEITIDSVCDNRLIIEGAFVANKMNFDRAAGGLIGHSDYDGPAEWFRFSPELYLGAPNIINEFVGDFEIHQFRDLPPVYSNLP